MGTDMRAHVLQLLKSYQDRERKIALLHYELLYHAKIAADEALDCMSFGRTGDSRSGPNRISDKTPCTEMNYRELADRLNIAVVNEITAELVKLEDAQNRLCYYVSRLESRQAAVLQLAFFDGLSWYQIAAKLSVAQRTTHKIKERALGNLAWMYQYMAGIKGNGASPSPYRHTMGTKDSHGMGLQGHLPLCYH